MPRLKKPRRSRFAEIPPSEADVRGILNAPETAPTGRSRAREKKPDGRSLRVTGRTVPFSTRVTAEWSHRLHRLAERTGLLYVEILERALDELERTASLENS